MSKSLYCQKCGRTVPMSTTFCPRCGGGDIAPAPIKKAAARPDAEPVIGLEEPRILITDVGTRLKAVAQKLEKHIRKGMQEDLNRVEKRAEKLTKRHCC